MSDAGPFESFFNSFNSFNPFPTLLRSSAELTKTLTFYKSCKSAYKHVEDELVLTVPIW